MKSIIQSLQSSAILKSISFALTYIMPIFPIIFSTNLKVAGQ
jgi:hypothetical protein